MKKLLRIAVVQSKVPKSHNEGEVYIERLLKIVVKKYIDMVGFSEECLASREDISGGYEPFNFI